MGIKYSEKADKQIKRYLREIEKVLK